MWRAVHRWPGVIIGPLLVFLSITGSILAVDPVLDRFDRYADAAGEATVGDVLRLTATKNPYFVVDRLRVDGAGRVLLRGSDPGGSREVPIDLATGRLARLSQPNAVMDTIRSLHRNLALGPPGRPVTLAGVLAMAVVTVSGLVLLARRLGGWRALLMPLRGHGLDRWHSLVGRIVVIPLLVVSVAGLWMALVTNGVLPSGADAQPKAPETTREAEPVPAHELAVWDDYRLADVTELTFPIEADWWDVYRLRTGGRYHFIDRVTGERLSVADVPVWTRALDLFVLLHTGEGAAPWAAVAGLTGLTVPFFTVTGVVIWWRRRTPRAKGGVGAAAADTVILVGSETGSTWGFAVHLAERLTSRGRRVHLAGMNARPAARPDALLIVLAATYGDGAPPRNAATFLDRLPTWCGGRRFAVLGFGDKTYPAYCAFAAAVHEALAASGRTAVLPLGDVNRRSPQAFAAWGRGLADALGDPDLVLDYAPPRPRTARLVLAARQEFGTAVQRPAAILRFRAERGRLPRFAAGDLLAVLPPGETVARLYSLASASREGFADLCVARVEGGVCSTHLLSLAPGEAIEAFVQRNPEFRPARRAPTLMVGAGTGIAPFAGMIRANRRRRPIELFFGFRHPDADYYWRDDLAGWQAEGRLAALHTAVSRTVPPAYVQDRIRERAADIRVALRRGATVMVCGGTEMARAVAREVELIAGSVGTSVADLRARGRYLEDIY